ncbi:MAG: OmpA family protein [Bacteroidales bacterium]|nr:OmpA family protein [Bacteroidales bacterium]
MKKLFVIAAALMACLSAGAQNYEFVPGWYLGVQGGAQYTAGESTFKNLISPTGSLNVGYQINPWFGLRGNFNGIQGKGWMSMPDEGYKFKYGQGALDATFNLADFGKNFKPHVVNPYVFVGVGGIYGFDNEEVKALEQKYPGKINDELRWDNSVASLLVRAGAGVDFRLSDRVLLGLEVADNAFTDKMNSKKGDFDPKDFDWNLSAQLGLKFFLGETYKTRYAAAQAAAAAEAARLAAEKAEKDRIAAEKAAAEKAAAEKAAAEKAAAEKAAAEKAAAEKAAAEKAAAEEAAKDLLSRNVYFLLDKTNIRKCETSKIDEVVECLKANPDAKVKVMGHADLPTGSHPHNQDLSKARATKVAKAIEKAGISKDRIITEWFGDTANPFPVQEENRVAVCIVNRNF